MGLGEGGEEGRGVTIQSCADRSPDLAHLRAPVTLSDFNMDFDDSSNKIVTREFVAVVLAGFGNE